MIDPIRTNVPIALIFGSILLIGCTDKDEPAPPDCRPEPPEWPPVSGSPRWNVIASMSDPTSGFRLHSKDVSKRIIEPVMRHCGLQSLENIAINSWLDPHTRLESFSLIRRAPISRYVPKCGNVAPTVIYVETKFEGGPIACLDCDQFYGYTKSSAWDSAFCADYPTMDRL